MLIAGIYLYVCFINSPEEKVKQMEKKVNELIEESCFANDRGEYPLVRVMSILEVIMVIWETYTISNCGFDIL